MFKKTLGLAAVLVVGLATPALAGNYADDDTIVLSDSTVAPGAPVTATVSGCEPSSPATFTINDSPAGEGTADADGNASADLIAPTEEGTHTVTGSCTGPEGEAIVLGTMLTVGTAAAGLPATGSNSSMPLARAGLAAVVVGGLLVLFATRRRSDKQAAVER